MKIIKIVICQLLILSCGYYAQEVEFKKVDQKKIDSIRFDRKQIDFLKKNGFVIVEKSDPVVNFNDIYQYNVDNSIPNYVTIDSILNTTSKIIHKYLWLIETEHLYPDMVKLAKGLYQISYEYYKNVNDPRLKKAALDNCCYFAVAVAISDENFIPPIEIEKKVMREIEMLNAAEGINRSPIFNVKDDYSNYEPTGYYRNSKNIRKYFKIKEWFSRKSFILEKDVSREIKLSTIMHNARCSLLIYLAINDTTNDKVKMKNIWERINQLNSLFFQRDEKYNFYNYDNICFELFSGPPSTEQLKDDKTIKNILNELRKSRKFSIKPESAQYVLFNGKISFNKYLLSLQKDPSFFSDMMYIFNLPVNSKNQKNNDVVEKIKKMEDKFWFKSIEIRKKTWNAFSSALKHNNPIKLNNDLWNKRIFITALGSWIDMTESKLIGVKSSVKMENAKAGNIKYTRGFVDPYPEIYISESDVIQTLLDKLSSYRILSEEADENLNRYITILKYLTKISKKEIEAKRPINSEEYKIIWKIGYELKKVSKLPGKFEKLLFYKKEHTLAKTALIGDNGKDQNMETALGKPLFLYVLIPDGINFSIASGPIYSYYEFNLPNDKIVSDNDWIELISLHSPAYPIWIKDMIYE